MRGTRPRWVAALVAAVVVALLPGAPAHAARGELICGEDPRTGWFRCWEVPVAVGRLIDFTCPKCAAIGFDLVGVRPADRAAVLDGLLQSVYLLGRADLATDEATKARLRASAHTALAGAGRALGEGDLVVTGTGYHDLGSNAFVRSPQPWQDAAAADLVTAAGLARVGASDPDGDPVRWANAIRALDEAFVEMK